MEKTRSLVAFSLASILAFQPLFATAGPVIVGTGGGAGLGATPILRPSQAVLAHPAYSDASNTLYGAPAIDSSKFLPAGKSDFGSVTGAVTRRLPDPGPIRKMWFVYETAEELQKAQDVLERVKALNPEVEIVFYQDKAVLPYAEDEDGKSAVDTSAQGRKALAERIEKEKAEFVLASNQGVYDYFRGLRDADLARDIPFGYAGRRHVAVDIPRVSLDPEVLSDVRALPHRNFLVVSADQGPAKMEAAGMQGRRAAFEDLLKDAEAAGHGPAKKDEDMGLVARFGMKYLLKAAGQADDGETAARRESAHRLAASLEHDAVDVLATDDPEAAKTLGLMKKMGYHKSLAVVWTGRGDPGDASAINMTLHRGRWMERASHVKAARRVHGRAPTLEDAMKQAKRLERLSDNFMDMGGVSVKDFEPTVADAIAKAVPPLPKESKRYDVHFLLTNGNGVHHKGDANPFGHFGMAVSDEHGKTLVWTVQYNDGGSFTGGLGDGKQLTLAEYLYSLWYLPGATGQAIPLAETAVSQVMDVVLRGAVDEAGLEAMRRVAADINARHLKGEDNYSFLNKQGATNCISLVTQILRAAGFAIAETGIQAPGDKAVELIAGLARRLLNNQVGAGDFGFVVFNRPAHAGPEHYRIANTVLGSPFWNRKKTWNYMTLTEKVWRVLTWLPTLVNSFHIPKTIESFAAMATHQVVVGPHSRELEIIANPDSPIVKMREAGAALAALRRARVPIEEELAKLNDELLKEGGFQDWHSNPEAVVESGRGKKEETRREALRRRHHRLEMALALSLFDEQIAQRTVEYQKLKLADVHVRYQERLAKVRDAHAAVMAMRDRMQLQDRVPEAKELEQLNLLNAEVENELQAVRVALLKDIGPLVPHDMTMISRQVTLATLDKLIEKGQSGGGKGKAEKKKS